MFRVLRSSAGAGKTHTLVKHYLTHCLQGEDASAYRHVLALTFTNKAAGEMKARVVSYLERITNGDTTDAALLDVMDHLMRETGSDEAAVTKRAEAVLGHLLHHWSEVAISTIDAFTRRVVQPFARDLQLDHDLRMTIEEEWYRHRAVELLIAEAGVDPQVTDLLTEACQQLLDDERAWDPGAPLRELSTELTKESAIGPLQMLRTLDPEALIPISDRLRKTNISFRDKLRRIGTSALKRIEDADLSVEDLYYTKTGFHGWFKSLERFGDKWITPGAQALKSFNGGKWAGTKIGPKAKADLEAIIPALLDLYQEAETLRQSGQRDYFIRKAVLRELAPSFALRELDRCLASLKQDDGVAFFSDLTRRVAQVVREEPVPYIYERLGERYRHFLIDEFQDTSLLQWNTLLPLIDNALSQGGSALLVGDAKQAIYRWRNGEVRLFTELPKLFGRTDDPLEMEREATIRRYFQNETSLIENRRSADTIVEFNNALFAHMAGALSADLRKVYAQNAQTPEKNAAGLVRIEVTDKTKSGEDAEAELLAFVDRGIEQALQDGFVPGDIAVLVRSKALGGKVARHLLRSGLPVVSPDGSRLRGDPVIELVIELLRFLHTSETCYAARILQLKAQLAASAEAERVDPFSDPHRLPDPTLLVRQWLNANGDPNLRTTLAALVTHLVRMTGIKPAEDAQIQTLLDEVHLHTLEHGQDIGGFLEHWERSGGERSSVPPADVAAIQVMTVHKAKGLEFPVVIMPSARMASAGNTGGRLWISPGPAVPELPQVLVRESGPIQDAELPELKEEAELEKLDHANLLYVGFTRAQQRLYAQVPATKPDAITSTLLSYVEEHGTDGVLSLGERTAPWKQRTSVRAGSIIDVGAESKDLTLALRLEAPEHWDPADPDPYRRLGNAIHAVLGRVEHAKNLEEALNSAVVASELEADEATELLPVLHRILTSPELSPWYGADRVVRTEASLITADGRSLRPDRIVFEGDVVRVLDIKTGAASEHHHEQVRTYMQLLSRITNRKVEGAILYIPDGKPIPVAA